MNYAAEKLVTAGVLSITVGTGIQFGLGWACIVAGILAVIGGFVVAYAQREG